MLKQVIRTGICAGLLLAVVPAQAQTDYSTVPDAQSGSDESYTGSWAAGDTGSRGEQNAEWKDWAFITSVTFEHGDFGTNDDVDTIYVPFTLQRNFEQGDVAFTLPFIYQESNTSVSAVNGRPRRIRAGAAGGTRSESGLGDMLLKGRYYALHEAISELKFNVSPFVQFKLPTADEDKGLGTGEWDTTFGVETSKTLNAEWAAYVDLFYTFIGEPAGTDLDNEFGVLLGAGYQLDEVTLLSLFYEERTALVDDEDNLRDLIFGLNYQVEEDVQLFGNLRAGLSDGTSSVGLTVGVNVAY